MKHITLFVALAIPAAPALADPPEIRGVTAESTAGSWRISVTLAHPDTGWDHYADGWEVLDANGDRLGLRKLHHPHENEQPFTRSLGGVTVPEGTKAVFVRARCSVDGWSESRTRVELAE